MKTCFDLASVALLDLIVRAHERRAACHVASDQENDVDAEEDVEHGSISRDVFVDQVQAEQQNAERAKDDEANEFVEVHESLLGAREQNEAADEQRDADDIKKDAKGEGERVHGSVLKQGAKRPEEAAYCEEAHEAQGEEGGGGHSSHRFLVAGEVEGPDLVVGELEDRRAALVVATPTHWSDLKRLGIVAVVVVVSRRAAVSTHQLFRQRQFPSLDGATHSGMGGLAAVVVEASLRAWAADLPKSPDSAKGLGAACASEGEPDHLCLRAGLGGDRALAAALVQSNQSLTKHEARALCFSGGEVTDRRLLAIANRGDVYLPEVAGPKVGDE